MPVIVFEGGTMETEMKRTLIRRLTETAAEVTAIPAAAFVTVIHEQPYQNLGLGGETVADIKARQ
ncbi:4-oxalocrotonate tautomerase DmpI [Geomonas subterranea]|uniref:Tautomerase family protein n=1 Tax=Geomonas subterranea TaxID=2847989 RepID=A0ABX8LLK6_9BACT|nr:MULTISPECIES: 4-oxalocrotonate tautomerase DmpI [Geomonas]QXE92767.1 tautomerase family protein [Geomonas subterranea]QXM09129.1 tautomerase family protein [Geomonas subterranea]